MPVRFHGHRFLLGVLGALGVQCSEEWKNGRMEDWKVGRVEGRKTGRMEEWGMRVAGMGGLHLWLEMGSLRTA